MIDKPEIMKEMIERRKTKRLSNFRICRIMGANYEDLALLENGQHDHLTDTHINAYSMALGINPDVFMAKIGRCPASFLEVYRTWPLKVGKIIRLFKYLNQNQLEQMGRILTKQKQTTPQLAKTDFESWYNYMTKNTHH